MVEIVTEIVKSSGDLYYPKTSEVVIERQMPYEVDSATIKLAEHLASISALEVYDEVNVLFDDVIAFSGRLDKRSTRLSVGDNEIEWIASDHGQVLDYINVSSVKSYSSTNVGTIIENLRSSFVSADLTGTNIATGPAITNYNVPAWSKNILSCYKELARIADYNLWVDWDKDIHFEAKPTSAKPGFGVLEGENLISLNRFDLDITAVRNYVKVIGDTGFSAFAENSTSQTNYHKREFPYIDPSLGSNNACQEIANAIKATEPTEAIDVSIVGEIHIDPGDLLSVDIPEYNIAANYEVSGVTHMVSRDTYSTDLELGTKKVNLSRIMLSLGMNIDRIGSGFL